MATLGDKAVFIVLALYAFSFGFLGAQFLADSYGHTMTTPDGEPVTNALTDVIQITSANSQYTSIDNEISENQTAFSENPLFYAASIAWSLFQLFTGTYIFNLMYVFGIPAVFIVPISFIYGVILLPLLLIEKARGI